MANFNINRKFDLILCMLDSINHIVEYKRLIECFKSVQNHLNNNGIFIFDINTEYKFENVLSNNVFYQVDDEISYIWQNNFSTNTKVCEFDITIFVKSGDKYDRFDDLHWERAYSVGEIEEAIKYTDIEIINKYSDINLSKIYNKNERIFFICRKLES